MPACRACRHTIGQIVLDLGCQPACDHFPSCAEPGPDPLYPLQMWLCAECGLAQLVTDPTVPREPRGTEPAALAAQAADAVGRAAAAGLLRAGARVAEYGSPHGGSWIPLLSGRNLVAVEDGERADVVVDCFGLMHAADQHAALAGRLARLDADGVLLVQYHSLATIIKLGQWNALRHGHYAYYSTEAIVGMLSAQGFAPVAAWRFDLYGGTVLLAAKRTAEIGRRTARNNGVVADLLAEEARVGVRDPVRLFSLENRAHMMATSLVDWLAAEKAAGRLVLGYGAASRAVALLCKAGVGRGLLPAIADASPAKHGLRMPGTDIPIISPTVMSASPPDSVLLFVSDLRDEVTTAFPEVEAAGGRWVDADSLEPVTVRTDPRDAVSRH
jgi:hypothetical protein